MTNNKTFFTGLALLLILTLAGCGGASTKKTDFVTQQHEDTPAADEPILTKLLRNSAKVVRLKYVVEHGGQVYAGGYPDIPGGYWDVPGWKPVEPNPDAEQLAIVGNTIIYDVNTRYAPELWRMDLQTGAKTLIADNIGYTRWSVCIAGDRIIFTTRDDDFSRADVFWYDLKTSQTTKLLDKEAGKEFESVVSFDNDFVYYSTSNDVWQSDLWRVRWDGTHAEVMKDVKMPENLYKVEGDYYYCMETIMKADDGDWRNLTTKISQYTIDSEKPKGDYTVYAWGLEDLEDGWAYFNNKEGIHKINMTNGATVKLAATLKDDWDFRYIIGIVGDDMYVKASKPFGDCYKARIYKVPLQGGAMEYQNKEWDECGD